MELRKLISFGNSSFVVSLPRAWVSKNRLKKGDLLRVEELPTEIVISSNDTDERRVAKEVNIDAKNKGLPELRTEIISSYINNYNVISVYNFSNAKDVKDIFQELIGIELIEENATKIVAKDLLDVTEVSMSNIIRRIDILVRSMSEDVSIEKDNYESIFGRDKEVNRLSLLCFRLVRAVSENPRLLRAFNTTNWEMIIDRHVATQLERFADQIKRMTRMLRKVKGKNERKSFAKEYSVVKARYAEVMKVYYTKNRQQAFKMESETKEIMKQCDDFAGKCGDRNCIAIAEYMKQMISSMTVILRAVMESD